MALEFAERTVRQTMTLTAGIFTLSAVFADELAADPNASGHLLWSWGFYAASFASGLLVLYALTGYLAGVPNLSEPGQEVPVTRKLVDTKWITRPGRFQLLTFGLGTAFLIVAAWRRLAPGTSIDESFVFTLLLFVGFVLGLAVRSLVGWTLRWAHSASSGEQEPGNGEDRAPGQSVDQK